LAVITVRNLDEGVQRRLKQRAAAHDRSMEAEARAILSAAVVSKTLVHTLRETAARFGGVDIELPARNAPRVLDLS